MNQDAQFPVGEVFPADARGAALARFLVLARQAEALRGGLAAFKPASAAAELEGGLFLLGCYIGSLKETADAFRDPGVQDEIAELSELAPNLTELATDAEIAQRETDKRDSQSLYSRFLKRVRDEAGFHVQRSRVEHLLAGFSGATLSTARVKDDGQEIEAVPIVELLMSGLLWKDVHQPSDVTEVMAVASDLHNALRNVAHDLYLLRVRIATELPPEPEA